MFIELLALGNGGVDEIASLYLRISGKEFHP